MSGFVPGLELARLYYEEAVRPILDASFPDLVHSAGLLGPGSEVLGFDDAMSTDHDWGPQLVLCLSSDDHASLADDLRRVLGDRLPVDFLGYPTHYEEDLDDAGTFIARHSTTRPINHRVQITTLRDFVRHCAGLDLEKPLSVIDWLTVPEQMLRSLVAGGIFHDGLDVLDPMQKKLAYYPGDLWYYLLSAQWQRIGQDEAFVGRSGFVGDELGSTVIAARLVRDVMRLCFLMEKQYAPYSKWFGSAFAMLDSAPRLTPILEWVVNAGTWQDRQKRLGAAYEELVRMHNALRITAPQPVSVSQFHSRPFLVIQAERIAKAIWDAIEDPEVRRLPYGVGKVDQWVDSTDVLSHIGRSQRLSALYTAAEEPYTGPARQRRAAWQG